MATMADYQEASPKKKLMACLSVGEVVKCRIKFFTYIGYFVEVEEVTALLTTKGSDWTCSSSTFKTGEIIEAEVRELDFEKECIFLSLKEITADSSQADSEEIELIRDRNIRKIIGCCLEGQLWAYDETDLELLASGFMQAVSNNSIVEIDNPDLRDRPEMYWPLLSTDLEATKDVVLAEKPVSTDDSNQLDPSLLDELLANIATLSSVYHKPPKSFVTPIKTVDQRTEVENYVDSSEEGYSESSFILGQQTQ